MERLQSVGQLQWSRSSHNDSFVFRRDWHFSRESGAWGDIMSFVLVRELLWVNTTTTNDGLYANSMVYAFGMRFTTRRNG